ncbi:MAG: DUF308 domain-containing protein [Aristaeellaceae bacterium]
MKEKLRGKSQWIIMGILEVLIGILLLENPVYFTAGIVIAAGILLILGGPDERLALLQGLARRGGV